MIGNTRKWRVKKKYKFSIWYHMNITKDIAKKTHLTNGVVSLFKKVTCAAT